MTLTVQTPSQILIGGGSVGRIVEVLKALNVSRPLIVTDRLLAASPLFARLTAPLKAAGIRYMVFQDGLSEPTTAMVRAGAEVLGVSNADGLIAFGGGSPMDTAKAMAILHAGGGSLRDWKVPNTADMPVLPLVCMPTTAGTGAEVTRFCVITDVDGEVEEKMLIMGRACIPAAAIVDHEFTFSLPSRLTADTGLDALTHAIECFVSRKSNPYSDALALRAMALLHESLPRVYRDGQDGAAREAMAIGATLAGMAFSNSSVALVHGMSRPVGAFFHVPHGLSNAMLLPSITAYSISGAPDRYAACARAMGCAASADGDDAAATGLIASLHGLNAVLEVPSLARFGIDRAAWRSLLPTMAEQAAASGSPANNPRVPSVGEMIDLYEQLWV